MHRSVLLYVGNNQGIIKLPEFVLQFCTKLFSIQETETGNGYNHIAGVHNQKVILESLTPILCTKAIRCSYAKFQQMLFYCQINKGI